MNDRDFLYWLNGFFELTESSDFTVEQAAKVNKHILLVLESKHESDSVIHEVEALMRNKNYNGVKNTVDNEMLRLTNSDSASSSHLTDDTPNERTAKALLQSDLEKDYKRVDSVDDLFAHPYK